MCNKIQDCLKDLKTWMTLHFFMLNTAKTEVIVLGPKNLRNKLLCTDRNVKV